MKKYIEMVWIYTEWMKIKLENKDSIYKGTMIGFRTGGRPTKMDLTWWELENRRDVFNLPSLYFETWISSNCAELRIHISPINSSFSAAYNRWGGEDRHRDIFNDCH